jgi:hypothetical protein
MKQRLLTNLLQMDTDELGCARKGLMCEGMLRVVKYAFVLSVTIRVYPWLTRQNQKNENQGNPHARH